MFSSLIHNLRGSLVRVFGRWPRLCFCLFDR